MKQYGFSSVQTCDRQTETDTVTSVSIAGMPFHENHIILFIVMHNIA